MGGFFDFSLLDVWNNPVVQILRAGTKLGLKAATSASAKAEHDGTLSTEMAEIHRLATSGDSSAQCFLALCYAEQQEYESASYWLMQSAEQGNEHALKIVDMLQKG